MKYGYYLTVGNQYEETSDHVNLLWLDDQRIPVEDLAIFTRVVDTCVLDVSGSLFDGKELRTDATNRLADLKKYINKNGRLHTVTVIVPVDEPNLPEHYVQHYIPEAVRIIKDVWPEALVGCIYYNDGIFEHHELYDIVGFDDYLAGYSIFKKPRFWECWKLYLGKFVRRGSYLRFLKLLRSDQRTWLIPGGAYREKPAEWVDYAKKNVDRVWGVVPFLWASHVDGSTFNGIRDNNALKEQYIAAGKELTQ